MSRVQLRGSLRLNRLAFITKRVRALHVRCALVATICSTALGCGEGSATRVMLLVDADAATAGRATGLRLEIWGWAPSEMALGPMGAPDPGGVMQPSEAPDFRDELSLTGSLHKFPRRFAVAPLAGDASRQFLAQVTLLVDERMLAVSRVQTGFTAGRVLALPMYFTESCLSESLRCNGAETCVDGSCVPASVAVDTLQDFDRTSGAAGRASTTSASGRAGAGGSAPRRAPMNNRDAGQGAAGEGSAEPSDCGDGSVSGDETCDTAIQEGIGACPTQCSISGACETQHLEGSGCQARCVSDPVAAQSGDGCCAPGTSAGDDSDCRSVCGNEILEGNETCDPSASCPTAESCKPTGACFHAALSGDPAQCTSECRMEPIVDCIGGDGCCPMPCSPASDSDCSAACGDGVIDPLLETCEPNHPVAPCRSTCDDDDSCTFDVMTGSSTNCNVLCTHLVIRRTTHGDGCCPEGASANADRDCEPSCGNGVIEAGELCDAICPKTSADCSDDDPCTRDSITGAGCGARCEHTPIDARAGDGLCCGATGTPDADCASCGNGMVEPPEECDCPGGAACSPALPACVRCTDSCRMQPRAASGATMDGCCPDGLFADTDADCRPRPEPPATDPCGNGTLDPGEACDGSASVADCNPQTCRTASATCDSDCKVVCAYQDMTPCCGNGVVEGTEQCDGEPGCVDCVLPGTEPQP